MDEGFWANPIPHEGRSCTVGNAWLGDVDGDGADDVVAWAHDTVHGTQTLIWRAVGDGWVLVPLGGMADAGTAAAFPAAGVRTARAATAATSPKNAPDRA